MIRKSAILIFFCFITIIAFSQNKKLKWLDGVWSGKGYQVNNETWNVVLKYSKSTGEFSVQYPGLKCIGFWKVEKAGKDRLETTEFITQGECDKEVKVIVTKIDEENISVVYFLPKQREGVIAFAVLKKSQ